MSIPNVSDTEYVDVVMRSTEIPNVSNGANTLAKNPDVFHIL